MASLMPQNPFVDTDDPPPIPPRSPERTVSQWNIMKPFHSPSSAHATQRQTRSDFDYEGQSWAAGSDGSSTDGPFMCGANNEDEFFDFAELRPSPSRSRLNNLDAYAAATEYEKDLAYNEGSARSPSLDTSGSGGSKSHESASTLDATYVHPFPQARSQTLFPGQEFSGPERGANTDKTSTSLPRHLQSHSALTSMDANGTLMLPQYTTLINNESKTSSAPSSRADDSVASSTLSHIHNTNGKSRLSTIRGSPLKASSKPRRGHKLTSGLKRLGEGSKKTPTREQKLLKTAIWQNHLLEQERRQTVACLYLEPPRLYPSPRVRPRPDRHGMGERETSSSVSGLVTPNPTPSNDDLLSPRRNQSTYRRHVIRSPSFWIFFTLTNFGIVATGAAFAVLIRNKKAKQHLHPSASMILWLVCAIGAIILGLAGCLCVWGLGNPKFVNWMCKAGLEELGLLLHFEDVRRKTAREREEEERILKERKERGRERERLMGRANTMASVMTVNPEWQILYATQEELGRISGSAWSARVLDGRQAKPVDLEILVGDRVRKINRHSAGAETMLSGGTPLREFNEQDVGMQILTPSRTFEDYVPERLSHFHKVKERSHTTLKPRSRQDHPSFPFTKRNGTKVVNNEDFLPPHLQHQKDPSETDLSTPRFISRLSKEREVASHLSYDFSITKTTLPLLSTSRSTIPSPENFKFTEQPIPILPTSPPSAAAELHILIPAPRGNFEEDGCCENDAGTIISSYSPLESLARDLNTPELRNMSAAKQADYFAERRIKSEEREKRIKETLELERKGTVGSKYSSRSGIESDGNYGRQRSALRESFTDGEGYGDDFSSALDPVVAETWDGEYSHTGKVGIMEDECRIPRPTFAPIGLDKTLQGAFVRGERDSHKPTPELAINSLPLEAETSTAKPTEHPRSITPQPINPFLTRKLKPMIMERVRNLEQREEDLRNPSEGSAVTTNDGTDGTEKGFKIDNGLARRKKSEIEMDGGDQ